MIEKQLQNSSINGKISQFQNEIKSEICSTIPNAFWNRKIHIISLPYNFDFPIQMNKRLLDHCFKKIKYLLDEGLIRPSKLP